MGQILLTEQLFDEAQLVESVDANKNFFMSGIMMMGRCKNGNGREYATEELSKITEESMTKIKSGHPIMGELCHPENLIIDLKNVSHAITEMRMDGDNVVGKMKLLNTPAGNLARGILEGGVRLGVSSRGSGNVDTSGKVSGFNFLTVDIVAVPSAQAAYPDLVREGLENQKIMTLAEAVVHDPKAQIYFKKEMQKFISSILGK